MADSDATFNVVNELSRLRGAMNIIGPSAASVTLKRAIEEFITLVEANAALQHRNDLLAAQIAREANK